MSETPPPPQRSAEVRLGPWLSETFERYADRWGVWIGQGVVYTIAYLIAMVPFAIGYVYWYWPFLKDTLEGRKPDLQKLITRLPEMGMGTGAMLIISFLVLPWLTAGMTRTAAKQLRGEPIGVGDIFSAGDVYFRAVGEYAARTILVAIGMFCCVVPAFIVMGLLMYAHPRIVLDDRGVIDAIGDSWNRSKKHVWMYVLWSFLLILIATFGSNLLIVGLALTWPVWPLATVIAHRDVFGIAGAEPRLVDDETREPRP